MRVLWQCGPPQAGKEVSDPIVSNWRHPRELVAGEKRSDHAVPEEPVESVV